MIWFKFVQAEILENGKRFVLEFMLLLENVFFVVTAIENNK